MNERIKELSEQTWAYATEKCPDYIGIADVYTEKFAELIMQECVSAVNSADDSGEDFWGNVIKEHFGVE